MVHGAIVVGGGFFGCSLALELSRRGARVLLLEQAADLMTRASWNNQARVHHGYHYPRSILTGLRSRVNYPRFVAEFPACVDRSFRHYYAIARKQSHVTARQFETFCRRIGAPLARAPAEVRAWFTPRLIEEVYEVEEIAFDAGKLREALRGRLRQAGVEVRFSARVEALARGLPGPGGPPAIVLRCNGEELRALQVFNCTYAGLNRVLTDSGLPVIPLRHEWTELCLVQAPPLLAHAAVTVMCGPFFSLMPFPPAGAHSLSHVRYTPHCSWEDRDGPRAPPAGPRATHFPQMQKDAQRYLPALSGLVHLRSSWEVKTVLPQSEHNDSRPILFKRSEELPGLVSVLGGKFDNVYDLPRELDQPAAVLRTG